MNFVTAIVWPVYWMKRIDTGQVWIWFVMAYAGYWVGLKLAQALIQTPFTSCNLIISGF